MPPSAEVCCQSSDPGGVGADLFLAGERQFHILRPRLLKASRIDAVVGGDIDQAVAGEVLEHALADAVIGGCDAEGKGVAGASAVWTLRPSTEMTWRNSVRFGDGGSFSVPTLYSETIWRTDEAGLGERWRRPCRCAGGSATAASGLAAPRSPGSVP